MRIVHEGLSPVEFTQHAGKRVRLRTTDGHTETGILKLSPRAVEVWPKGLRTFLSVPYRDVAEIKEVDGVAK